MMIALGGGRIRHTPESGLGSALNHTAPTFLFSRTAICLDTLEGTGGMIAITLTAQFPGNNAQTRMPALGFELYASAIIRKSLYSED